MGVPIQNDAQYAKHLNGLGQQDCRVELHADRDKNSTAKASLKGSDSSAARGG